MLFIVSIVGREVGAWKGDTKVGSGEESDESCSEGELEGVEDGDILG